MSVTNWTIYQIRKSFHPLHLQCPMLSTLSANLPQISCQLASVTRQRHSTISLMLDFSTKMSQPQQKMASSILQTVTKQSISSIISQIYLLSPSFQLGRLSWTILWSCSRDCFKGIEILRQLVSFSIEFYCSLQILRYFCEYCPTTLAQVAHFLLLTNQSQLASTQTFSLFFMTFSWLASPFISSLSRMLLSPLPRVSGSSLLFIYVTILYILYKQRRQFRIEIRQSRADFFGDFVGGFSVFSKEEGLDGREDYRRLDLRLGGQGAEDQLSMVGRSLFIGQFRVFVFYFVSISCREGTACKGNIVTLGIWLREMDLGAVQLLKGLMAFMFRSVSTLPWLFLTTSTPLLRACVLTPLMLMPQLTLQLFSPMAPLTQLLLIISAMPMRVFGFLSRH